jgi:hypothetical protein
MTPVSTKAPATDVSRLGSVPREVRLTGNGKAAVAMAILCAAAAVALAIGLSILHARQQAAADLRAREGVHAIATVVSASRTREEHPRSVVTYRYDAAGRAYQNTLRLPERDRRQFVEGDQIGILYLRSRPAISWAAGDEPGVLPIGIVPLIAGALLLIAWLIAWNVGREKTLLSEGRLAEARIVSTKRVHSQHHHGYRIAYEFTTLSGAKIAARVERRRAPAGVGATVPVIYHRDNPRRNALYPLTLVAPARQ